MEVSGVEVGLVERRELVADGRGVFCVGKRWLALHELPHSGTQTPDVDLEGVVRTTVDRCQWGYIKVAMGTHMRISGA